MNTLENFLVFRLAVVACIRNTNGSQNTNITARDI